MRARVVLTAVALSVSALGGSCASHPAASPALAATAAPTAAAATAVPARKLPHAKIDFSRDWYPWQGRLQNLQGQTLLRFQINRRGRATEIKVVASDAAPVLQVTAVQLIQSAIFDLKSAQFDASDKRPFLVAVRFCLDRCSEQPQYPGMSDSIQITAARVK